MADRQLLEFLCSPDAYPERPDEVRLIETHISWVFIGDEFVYKIKKPVDYDFLDFTTLEKRRFYTHEELRLNRRFSPDIYLDVIPVSKEGSGFFFGESDHVVEYALKMKRIKEEVMLSSRLTNNTLSIQDAGLVGRQLAVIYNRIPSSEKARYFGSVSVIAFNVMENFAQTRKYIGSLVDEKTFTALESWNMDFMARNGHLFRERIEQGRIKECHGDLHLQHVGLDRGKVVLFDCIEFNERFRYVDTASDVAFLSMDFDYNGRGDLGRAFEDAFIEASGDASLRDILLFYKMYRAHVRAKVASFMSANPGAAMDRGKTVFDKARKYYTLAYRYMTQ